MASTRRALTSNLTKPPRLSPCLITYMPNRFINEHNIAEFNRCFTEPAAQRGTAFISCWHRNLEMVFTQRFERIVDRDNTVRFMCCPVVGSTKSARLSESRCCY